MISFLPGSGKLGIGHVFQTGEITESTSTKLDIKHEIMKMIQVCPNEGPRPLPRGDNSYIQSSEHTLTTSSQEPLGQFKPNLAQNTLRLSFFQMKDLVLFLGGNKKERVENIFTTY